MRDPFSVDSAKRDDDIVHQLLLDRSITAYGIKGYLKQNNFFRRMIYGAERFTLPKVRIRFYALVH